MPQPLLVRGPSGVSLVGSALEESALEDPMLEEPVFEGPVSLDEAGPVPEPDVVCDEVDEDDGLEVGEALVVDVVEGAVLAAVVVPEVEGAVVVPFPVAALVVCMSDGEPLGEGLTVPGSVPVPQLAMANAGSRRMSRPTRRCGAKKEIMCT